MTTSISNELAHDSATTATVATVVAELPADARSESKTRASSFIILSLCLAIVLSALAYGTVHGWSLAVFQIGAGLVVILWMVDGWLTRALRVSRNALQWPLIGLLALASVQLLPFAGSSGGASSLSLDPYATRFVLLQVLALFIYFAAALAFVNSPQRLRFVVRTITVFGFLLAGLGLVQHFTSPRTIYWVREVSSQAVPFGPFFNSHHFAGYMELALALPLGLLMSGAVPGERRLLYAFAIALMGVALIVTASRGGIISFVAEVFFVVIVSGLARSRQSKTVAKGHGRARSVALWLALGVALLLTVLTGVLFFGGESALNRLAGTVSEADPTNGRLHFWRGTLDMIREHPLMGVGLGAFSVAYTRYDTSNGFYRLEQAHNDYLQILSDGGAVGAVLGLGFIVLLFGQGLARAQAGDDFRRGVAIGALAGCLAVLIHSFFDFTLHTTANALLFLVLAALATLGGQVEQPNSPNKRSERHGRSRRRSQARR